MRVTERVKLINRVGQTDILSGDVDPTVGAGIAAPMGSIYLRNDGTLYSKIGLPDTSWQLLGTATAANEKIYEHSYAVSEIKNIRAHTPGGTFPYVMLPGGMEVFTRRVGGLGEPALLETFEVFFDGVPQTYQTGWYFYGRNDGSGNSLSYNSSISGNWYHGALNIGGTVYQNYDIILFPGGLGGVTNVEVRKTEKLAKELPGFNVYMRNSQVAKLSSVTNPSFSTTQWGGSKSYINSAATWVKIHNGMSPICPPKMALDAIGGGPGRYEFESMGYVPSGAGNIEGSIRAVYTGYIWSVGGHIDYIYPDRYDITHPGATNDWIIEKIFYKAKLGRNKKRRIHILTGGQLRNQSLSAGFEMMVGLSAHSLHSQRGVWYRIRNAATYEVSKLIGPFGSRVRAYSSMLVGSTNKYLFYIPYYPGA